MITKKPKLTAAQFITLRGLAATMKLSPAELATEIRRYQDVPEVDREMLRKYNRDAIDTYVAGSPCPLKTKAKDYAVCGNASRGTTVRAKDGATLHRFSGCDHTVVRRAWRRADEDEIAMIKAERPKFELQGDGSFVVHDPRTNKPLVRLVGTVWYITTDIG